MRPVVMVDWLYTELTRPIDGSLETLAIQYVLFLGVGLVCHGTFLLVHRYLVGPFPSLFETLSYRYVFITAVVIAPLAEELLFRAVPLWLASSGTQTIWLGLSTVIWVILHGRRGAVFAATGGLLFVKLWMNGLGVQAIGMHAFHNLWVVLAMIGWHWVTTRQQSASDLPTTPDLRETDQ